MAITHLYHTVLGKIRQLRPHERVTRVRNMSWLMTGMFMARSVHLSHIARKLPGSAQKLSKEKRLSRLLHNVHIQVRQWYEPMARALLLAAHQSGKIRLVLDGSKIGLGHQLLMVSLAYRRRTLPIAWTWVSSPRGHSSAYKQCALLAYVHSLIPPEASVEVVGDSEFGAVAVMSLLDAWGWRYALRQKGNHLLRWPGQPVWQRSDALIAHPGEHRWLEQVALTQQHAYQTNFLAYWQAGEKEPWLLATNFDTPHATLRAYRRRMWIDEMFGDFKKHGFDLASTRLRHLLPLSRLTLAVAFLYVWLVAFGAQTIKNGQRRLVDRSNRRDLSIFRIGFDMLERRLANGEYIPFRLIPYFT